MWGSVGGFALPLLQPAVVSRRAVLHLLHANAQVAWAVCLLPWLAVELGRACWGIALRGPGAALPATDLVVGAAPAIGCGTFQYKQAGRDGHGQCMLPHLVSHWDACLTKCTTTDRLPVRSGRPRTGQPGGLPVATQSAVAAALWEARARPSSAAVVTEASNT